MTNELLLEPSLQSQKTLVRWLYITHTLCLLFSLGSLSFIPLIVNYLKRKDSDGTFVRTHHSWQIRSFWWFVVWIAVGLILIATVFLAPLGWLIWCLAWLWKAYRLIRGFIDLNEDKAMPA